MLVDKRVAEVAAQHGQKEQHHRPVHDDGDGALLRGVLLCQVAQKRLKPRLDVVVTLAGGDAAVVVFLGQPRAHQRIVGGPRFGVAAPFVYAAVKIAQGGGGVYAQPQPLPHDCRRLLRPQNVAGVEQAHVIRCQFFGQVAGLLLAFWG